MKTWERIAVAFVATVTGVSSGDVVAAQGFGPRRAQVPASDTQTQIEFVENLGQWATSAKFVATVPGGMLLAEPAAIGIDIAVDGSERTYLRMQFEGADAQPVIEGTELHPGLRHYFRSNDSSKWIRNARAFGRVVWRDLYPGIDLVLRAEGGRAKYDLLLAAGADLSCVQVRCEGVIGILVDAESGVLMETPAGPIEQQLGRCWQTSPSGETRDIGVRVIELSENVFGFELIGHDPALATVIDPSLLWSTYFGGSYAYSGGDLGEEAEYDATGDVYLTGAAELPGFPKTPGAYQHLPHQYGSYDLFIAKFRGATGQLVYSSVIGGVGHDVPTDLAVDGVGRAVVVGAAGDVDFPTTPGAFDPVKNVPNASGFVLRLAPPGDDLEFSTFLEGTTIGAVAYCVEVAASGAIVVAGNAYSADFPTTPGAFDTTFNTSGYEDCFVSRLDPTGSYMEWSTYLGGNIRDRMGALALHATGDVCVALISSDFPMTPGTVGQVHQGHGDVVVARLRSDGATLVWSTFVGGVWEDWPQAIGLLPTGDVVVAGYTQSINFPTTPGAFQTQSQINSYGFFDGFALRLNADASVLKYSTFLGGTSTEMLHSMEVDCSGVVTVCGEVDGPNYPTTPGAYRTQGWYDEIFVTRLHPAGSRLLYSTYVGGPANDFGHGVGVSSTGRVTAIGQSNGAYPVTPGSFPYAGGQLDAVITTFDPLLEGVQLAEPSVPACLGSLNLNAEPMPIAGSALFNLYCSNAPPNSSGGLAVWLPALGGTPFPIRPSLFVPGHSNGDGWIETSFPLTSYAAGTQLRFRYVFRNTVSCGGSGTVSLSNGLLVTVQ